MLASDPTQFRGLSGDVIYHFVKPSIWLTLMPVYAVWFLATMAMYMISPPDELLTIFTYGLTAWLVGRYALAASRGDTSGGFFSPELEAGDAVFFALRSLTFTFIWELPIVGLFHLIGSNASPTQLISPTSFLSAGLTGLVIVFLLLLMAAGPIVSFILATVTSKFSDAFSADPYKWLYSRRSDLPVLFASAIGGWILFFFIYLIPVLLICSGIASQSFQGAILAGFLVFLIPSASMPVLIGRLCGTFVHGSGPLFEKLSADMFTLSEEVIETESEVIEDIQAESNPEHPPFVPLAVDPSQEIIDWSKKELASLSAVENAYVYLRSQDGRSQEICIGIKPQDGLRLGDLSKLMKELDKLKCPYLYEILSGEILTEAVKSGMMIYKRRN